MIAHSYRRVSYTLSRGTARLLGCSPAWFIAIWAVISLVPTQAELVTRDLGNDLRYFRAQVIPSDLPSTQVKSGPLVLDLRYALAEAEAANAFDAWLKFRATAKTPVFLLINSETAPALRDMISASPATRPYVISIGRPTTDTKPDIAINTTADEERRAYDALESTKAVESLLVENTDKARVDEASIMRARSEAEEQELDANPLDRITPTETKAQPTARTPIDRALQRAVHLHHGLRALKRL
jgi:hypothetical protein